MTMRYYIQRDFPSLFDFDSFFNDFFESSSDRFPPVDVFETDNAYVIEAEVPGYKEDDIKIFCKNRVLTISSDAVMKERENGFITEEISLPSFQRSFQLPDDADEDMVSATSENGILSITISKKEKKEPKRIEVKIN